MTFAAAFSCLMALGALGFLVWACWSLGWELYDDWLVRRARKRNRILDRDIHRERVTPAIPTPWLRDFKSRTYE